MCVEGEGVLGVLRPPDFVGERGSSLPIFHMEVTLVCMFPFHYINPSNVFLSANNLVSQVNFSNIWF